MIDGDKRDNLRGALADAYAEGVRAGLALADATVEEEQPVRAAYHCGFRDAIRLASEAAMGRDPDLARTIRALVSEVAP